MMNRLSILRGTCDTPFFSTGNRIRPGRSLNILEMGRAAEDWEIFSDGKTNMVPPLLFADYDTRPPILRSFFFVIPFVPYHREREMGNVGPWQNNWHTTLAWARMRPDTKIYYPRTCRSSSIIHFLLLCRMSIA